jgi:DNA recombination protein RmuC
MFNSLILVVVVISVVLIWLVLDMKKELQVNQKKNETAPILERLAVLVEQNKSLSLQNRELRQTMDNKLTQTNQATREQIGQSIKSISAVTEKLVKIEETNKQIVNFSAQLKNLQDILKNPKQRGVLGEYF